MSTIATTRLPAVSSRPAGRSATSAAVVRVLAFGALALFCLAHYALLVSPGAGPRAFNLALLMMLGGAALAAGGRVQGARGTLLRVATLVALAALALMVTGVRARLLLPGHWDALGEGISRGFDGLDSFSWPYGGSDSWVRLTILLAMPLLAVAATALAFWPVRRGAATLRGVALMPLLIAYGMGVTNLGLGAWAVRGVALLLLIAAFLWLPRVRGNQALAGFGAVAVCAVAAMPLAAGLDARDPWLDYRSWDWFTSRTAGTSFGWDHSYGPINWSRSGVKLLSVKSSEPHYWKAETLDRFDGLRWMHSESAFRSGQISEDIPQPIPRRWNEQIRFTVRRLETKLVVGAGSVYRVDTDRATAGEPDGTVRILDSPLHQGDSYTVYAYVPDPTADQMRAAPPAYPDRLASATFFDLPSPRQSGLDRPDLSEAARNTFITSRTIQPPAPNLALSAADVARVEASPYGRVWRLAQRLGADQPTRYDVVKSVEGYLQRGFTYSEKPPRRRYPLSAFLFEDRIGYCQQFSGAMALMLRMNGIPARVATGFSPGALNHDTGEYEVRDLDAHSWVEVWFTGIGWVPFDPTPSLAPASSQSSAVDSSAARGGVADDNGRIKADIATPEGQPATGGAAPQGSRLWIVVVGLGALGTVLLAGLWLAGILRARTHFPATADGAVDELRAALERLGYDHPPRTTLADLERRLRVTAGEPAGRYVALLRALRYAPPGRVAAPGRRERRELRRALTGGRGVLRRLRGLVVLPPHPRRRAF